MIYKKGDTKNMYHFEYVSKKEYQPIKDDLIKLIHLVQNEVRDKFTFRYDFIGSSKRNMITRNVESNIGFDFDINIQVNDEDEEYDANDIKHILMNGFNSIIRSNSRYWSRFRYFSGWNYCEDNTRVFTIKAKDQIHSRILHSCDFAIVYNCSDGRQQYIRHNKYRNSYSWEYSEHKPKDLLRKEEVIKNNNLWGKVRKLYLWKKRNNTNDNKKSRSLYRETINEIYNKYC